METEPKLNAPKPIESALRTFIIKGKTQGFIPYEKDITFLFFHAIVVQPLESDSESNNKNKESEDNERSPKIKQSKKEETGKKKEKRPKKVVKPSRRPIQELKADSKEETQLHGDNKTETRPDQTFKRLKKRESESNDLDLDLDIEGNEVESDKKSEFIEEDEPDYLKIDGGDQSNSKDEIVEEKKELEEENSEEQEGEEEEEDQEDEDEDEEDEIDSEDDIPESTLKEMEEEEFHSAKLAELEDERVEADELDEEGKKDSSKKKRRRKNSSDDSEEKPRKRKKKVNNDYTPKNASLYKIYKSKSKTDPMDEILSPVFIFTLQVEEYETINKSGEKEIRLRISSIISATKVPVITFKYLKDCYENSKENEDRYYCTRNNRPYSGLDKSLIKKFFDSRLKTVGKGIKYADLVQFPLPESFYKGDRLLESLFKNIEKDSRYFEMVHALGEKFVKTLGLDDQNIIEHGSDDELIKLLTIKAFKEPIDPDMASKLRNFKSSDTSMDSIDTVVSPAFIDQVKAISDVSEIVAAYLDKKSRFNSLCLFEPLTVASWNPKAIKILEERGDEFGFKIQKFFVKDSNKRATDMGVEAEPHPGTIEQALGLKLLPRYYIQEKSVFEKHKKIIDYCKPYGFGSSKKITLIPFERDQMADGGKFSDKVLTIIKNHKLVTIITPNQRRAEYIKHFLPKQTEDMKFNVITIAQVKNFMALRYTSVNAVMIDRSNYLNYDDFLMVMEKFTMVINFFMFGSSFAVPKRMGQTFLNLCWLAKYHSHQSITSLKLDGEKIDLSNYEYDTQQETEFELSRLFTNPTNDHNQQQYEPDVTKFARRFYSSFDEFMQNFPSSTPAKPKTVVGVDQPNQGGSDPSKSSEKSGKTRSGFNNNPINQTMELRDLYVFTKNLISVIEFKNKHANKLIDVEKSLFLFQNANLDNLEYKKVILVDLRMNRMGKEQNQQPAQQNPNDNALPHLFEKRKSMCEYYNWNISDLTQIIHVSGTDTECIHFIGTETDLRNAIRRKPIIPTSAFKVDTNHLLFGS
jgi:hypothetical protein